MKHFEKINDGVWMKRNTPLLTEEQKTLLASKEESDVDAKKELNTLIASQLKIEATSDEVSKLDAALEANKPELKENDTYTLIHCAISLDDDKATGLINCRVNGEHIQVRF